MKNKFIKRDAKSGNDIYNQRSLEKDFRTLSPCIKEGMQILDVGCGTGAISSGMAKLAGPTGNVTGIDHTDHFIENGKETFSNIPNLNLEQADIFDYQTDKKFDLITAARVLQWLSTPEEALVEMKKFLKPKGQISILDYNHVALEFTPEPPKSFSAFYNKWLQWRSDAGMNNQISKDLPSYFENAGLQHVEIHESNEVYTKGDSNFENKLNIWGKVAEMEQLTAEGYMTENEKQVVLKEYYDWVTNKAERMEMKLKEVRGFHS